MEENMENKRKYWFFGSKLNTALLLVLIILMVTALCFMYKNKETYLPMLEQKNSQQSLEKFTNKSWNSFDITNLIQVCLGKEKSNGMLFGEAYKESIKECSDKARIEVAPGVEATIREWSPDEQNFIVEFYRQGNYIKEIPGYITSSGRYENINVSYFDDSTIMISEQCSEFEICNYFLLNKEWQSSSKVISLYLRIDDKYKSFFNSFPGFVYFTGTGINKDGNYIFVEEEGPCDVCEGEPYYSDEKDNKRLSEKGRLGFIFTNTFKLLEFGFLK